MLLIHQEPSECKSYSEPPISGNSFEPPGALAGPGRRGDIGADKNAVLHESADLYLEVLMIRHAIHAERLGEARANLSYYRGIRVDDAPLGSVEGSR
jgi:hypothetical protein